MAGISFTVGANGREQKDLPVRQTYQDFLFEVLVVGSEVNVPLPIIDPTKLEVSPDYLPPKFKHCVLDPSVFNPYCVTTTMKLTRGGRTTTNFDGPIHLLSMASSFYDSAFNNARWLTFEELTPASPTQKHEILISMPVRLPKVINLRDAEKLNIHLSVSNAAFDLNVIDTSLTKVRFKTLNAVGVATGIPQIHLEAIGYGQTVDDIPLEEGNIRICWLNTDKVTSRETDALIKVFNHVSDKVNGDQLDHTDLVSMRQRNFQNFDDANDRAMSFCLVDNEGQHDHLKLHFNTNIPNLTQGQNYITSHRVIQDSATQTIGMGLMVKHRDRNAKKLKRVRR